MNKALLVSAALAVASPAAAQTILPSPSQPEAQAPRPARAPGISSALATEAAQAAVAACAAQGLKVTALVVDSAAAPIAMVSGDGAAVITQRIASGKAVMAVKIKQPTGEVAARARDDQALMASLTADTAMGPPRQGGLPIRQNGEVVGAIAVSGAPSGAQDEPCARAGLTLIEARLAAGGASAAPLPSRPGVR